MYNFIMDSEEDEGSTQWVALRVISLIKLDELLESYRLSRETRCMPISSQALDISNEGSETT